jgi:hypothetical protein
MVDAPDSGKKPPGQSPLAHRLCADTAREVLRTLRGTAAGLLDSDTLNLRRARALVKRLAGGAIDSLAATLILLSRELVSAPASGES